VGSILLPTLEDDPATEAERLGPGADLKRLRTYTRLTEWYSTYYVLTAQRRRAMLQEPIMPERVPTKTTRLNVRTSPEQDTLIRQAAEASHTTMSEFMLESATARATQVLADRRWFQLESESYDEFKALLDRPAIFKPRLAASLRADDPFVD
jgi:uncharacterized protein (DUF1778 family)